jgi:hypothetical protein
MLLTQEKTPFPFTGKRRSCMRCRACMVDLWAAALLHNASRAPQFSQGKTAARPLRAKRYLL